MQVCQQVCQAPEGIYLRGILVHKEWIYAVLPASLTALTGTMLLLRVVALFLSGNHRLVLLRTSPTIVAENRALAFARGFTAYSYPIKCAGLPLCYAPRCCCSLWPEPAVQIASPTVRHFSQLELEKHMMFSTNGPFAGRAGYAPGGQHAQGISPLLQRARPAGAPVGPPGLQGPEGPHGAAVGPPTLAPPGTRPVQGALQGGPMPAGAAAGARQAQAQPLRSMHGSTMQGRAPGGGSRAPAQLGGVSQPAPALQLLQPPPGQHAQGISPVLRHGPLQAQGGGSANPAGGPRGSPSGRGGRSASLMGSAGQGFVPGSGLQAGAAAAQWAPTISSQPPSTMGPIGSPGPTRNPNPTPLQGQHAQGISPMLPKLQRAAGAAAGRAGGRGSGRYGQGSGPGAGAGAGGAAADEQTHGRGAAQAQGWPGHQQGAGQAYGSAAAPAHALGQAQPSAGAGALGGYAGVLGDQEAWALGSANQAR